MEDRIRGGMWGLLIGDALGVPYEWLEPEAIPPWDEMEMEPPEGISRLHAVPPGTWSDDGAQALCLLESLLTCGRFDPADFTARLVAWHDEGLWTVAWDRAPDSDGHPRVEERDRPGPGGLRASGRQRQRRLDAGPAFSPVASGR
nr:ADP-ribosylglycohydrolase family protein [Alicyclobacillus sendaiensis]